MINNFSKIKSLLDFSIPGTFYFIQIIKRRKDNPGLVRDMKRIAEYYVYSMKYFEEHEQQIIDEATVNNARVYIHLNRRNSVKTAMKALSIITEYVVTGQTDAAKTAYTSACGRQHSDPIKKWIVDIDEDLISDVESIVNYIDSNHPGEFRVRHRIPTKNGVHLLTYPFRKDTFLKIYPTATIHSDSPTVLFIP